MSQSRLLPGAEHGRCGSSSGRSEWPMSSSSRHRSCPYMICCGDEFLEVYIQSSDFSMWGFIRSWRKRAAEHNLSPSKGLGSQILILTDAKSGGRAESRNISWERWSQILKETTNQLVRANKMCKMAGSSPIHR